MRQKALFYLLPLLLILQACNLPFLSPSVDADAELATAVAQTLTQSALDQLSATTPTTAFTAEPQLTSTPTFAYVTLSEATNCRVGPGISYDLVDTFQVGQTIEVMGKHPSENFWYVRSPNNPSIFCWMLGSYAAGANLSNVPIVAPPPTFTAEPAGATIQPPASGTQGFIFVTAVVPKPAVFSSFVSSGKCLSWFTRIKLQNVGAVTVKSIEISLEDTVTTERRFLSMNGFQDVNACALSAITPTLASGESITVVGPVLKNDPKGHKLSATIKLCTEKGNGGSCSSATIEFTP